MNFTWSYQVDSSDVTFVDIGFGTEGGSIQYKYRLTTNNKSKILDDSNFNDIVNIAAIIPISISKGAVQVLINNVSLKDAGRFACRVGRFSSPITDDVKLTVIGKHFFFFS